MKPVFAVGGLYSESNGVAWIMRDLAAALGKQGHPVVVFGADCYGRGKKSIGEIFQPPTVWMSAKGLWLGGLSYAPGLKSRMRHVIQNADIVHNHSLWMLPNSYASRIGKKFGKPVVISIHGALEPWAMRNSSWKKQLVGRWFQFQDLRDAACLHVNSVRELEGIRKFGLRNPIAVIPNGVDWQDFEELPDSALLFEKQPHLKGKRILLFMARLHRKKGLMHLLEAWHLHHTQFPDWHLAIAGPDDGFEQKVRDYIREKNLERSVTLLGVLRGIEKRSALAAAECLVQPSFSEGFSMSILEAMASGTPVLITPGCNFPEAIRSGAAIEVEPDVGSTSHGLHEILASSAERLSDMGHRGRELIRKGFTWDSVAEQTLHLYRWLKGQDSKPEFVET
ncbi:MAG: glycosyltransferase [Planctomycetota bacterium]